MRRLFLCACMAALMTASSLCATAQDNPWNGSWKAVPDSMKYEAAPFSVTVDKAGYTITGESKVVCDGKPQTRPSGSELTCVKSGSTYTVTSVRGGKTVAVDHITPSGGTLTRKIDFTPPGEAPYSMSFTAKRVSGGPGLAGEWKPTGFSESQDTGVLGITVTGDSVAFKETDSPTPIVCKLDGTTTKTPSMGGGMAAKVIDPHTLKIIYTDDAGKVRRENTFVLSLDGKMISETDFTPDPGASGMTLLFHKM